MKLKDKVVVITGAGSGLGREIALKAADEGASIALVARSENELKEAQEQIKKKGGRVKYFVCDVKEFQEIKNTVAKIFKEFGRIDILVNNAGIWTDEEIEKDKPEKRKEALETNALGNINFIYEVLPHFKEKSEGYIFNVISTAGIGDIPSGNNVPWKTYGASKWAMTGFTKALRDDLKDTKIKVTGFHPGGFDSMLYEKAKRPNAHNQPWMMKVADVADIVIFALTRPSDVLMERIIVAKV